MPLRVATDFSGIDAPTEALEQMGIEYEYVWASDTNPDCRKVIAKHKPKHLFHRAQPAEVLKKLGPIDLYVAGFPCQQYSDLRKTGTVNRTKLFRKALGVVLHVQPVCFLFENVRGFKSSPDFREIVESKKLRELYHFRAELLNSLEYGAPQRRTRLE